MDTFRRRRLPPLTALRAFEAAARHRSFARAADELAVTATAISQQIRLLEEHLAVPLFLRRPRSVEPTAAGRALQPALEEAFDRIDAAVRDLGARKAGRLTVSVLPSFAARWLLPRFVRLRAALPELEVDLVATTRLADLRLDGVDMAVRFGSGRYPGLRADHLFSGTIIALCSPRLLEGGPPLRRPADLRHHTLIHEDQATINRMRELGWPEWLRANKVEGVDGRRGPNVNYTHLALQAAVLGQGVALSTFALAADDLAAGLLVQPFPEAVEQPYAYYLVCAEERADEPAIAAFRAWILEEVAQLSESFGAGHPADPD